MRCLGRLEKREHGSRIPKINLKMVFQSIRDRFLEFIGLASIISLGDTTFLLKLRVFYQKFLISRFTFIKLKSLTIISHNLFH